MVILRANIKLIHTLRKKGSENSVNYSQNIWDYVLTVIDKGYKII